MSVGSVISITYDGTDITDSVILATASFEAQMSAIPGTFAMTLKDPDQSLSFITGKEIRLYVDSVPTWGGFLMQVGRTHAFPADDTNDPEEYEHRYWDLRGVDYNILLDKLVLRDTSNFLSMVNLTFAPSRTDKSVIEEILSDFVDFPAGFDLSSGIDSAYAIGVLNPTKNWVAPQQGSTLRTVFEEVAKHYGQLYYINADKTFIYKAIETAEMRWGFSDLPNNSSITASPEEFQDSTIGIFEVEAIEDGSFIVNDALIWGGSAVASGGGGVVFARAEDATSQSTHGRWQLGEVHIGESGYGIQAGVDARADRIVNGVPGTDITGQQTGLRYSQWSFHFSWWAHDVPSISGQKDHLLPGHITNIEMNVFGLTKILPCRNIRISFPSGASDGKTYVQFEGDFGIQYSDPLSIWSYLLRRNDTSPQYIIPVGTSNDGSGSSQYGGHGQFTPEPPPDGTTTVFRIRFGYIAGTLVVYLNGLTQTPGSAYTESDPENGEFTMTFAPAPTDTLFVDCRTLVSTTGEFVDAPASIDSTGTTIVTSSLNQFIASNAALGKGTRLASGGTYKCDTLLFTQVHDINLDLNGATIRFINEHNPGLRFDGCNNVQVLNGTLKGNDPAAVFIFGDESGHGVYAGGGSNHSYLNLDVQEFRGDGYYFAQFGITPGSYATIFGGSIQRVARMGVAPVAWNHGVIDSVAIGDCYRPLDFEVDWNAFYVSTCHDWEAANVTASGYFKGSDGSGASFVYIGTPYTNPGGGYNQPSIQDINIHDCTVNQTGGTASNFLETDLRDYRATNITISNVTSPQSWGRTANLSGVDTLVVTNNVGHSILSPAVDVGSSTNVTNTGNS